VAIFDMKVTQVVGDGELPVSSVCRADAFNVRFSITVPEGRSPVQRVKPVLLVDGIESTAAPTPAGDYEPNGDGEVGTVGNPLGPRDVITYTYALTAPNAAGALDLTGSAQAFSTTVDAQNNFAPIVDILTKSLELAVADCVGNQPPTVTTEIISSTSTFSAPNANGWLKVEPVAPAPMVFTVRLTATDLDGGIRRITYQLSGVNAGAEQTVAIDSLPDGGFPATVVLDVPVIGDAEASQESPETLPGSTTVTFSALDNNFRPSAPGSVLVKLDNSVPNICFTIPYLTATAKSPTEHWWNGTVTIPASTNDAQGPTPTYVAPMPPELQGNSLVFALEGSGQFATIVAQDHVGHARTLSSNTTLDVCGIGRTGTNVNIDLTQPAIAADLAGGATIYQPGQMLTLTATDPPAATSPRANDGFSGVRRIEYSYDGFATPPIVTIGAIAIIELTQPVTIHYRSVDWAGNRSVTASRTFTVNWAPVAVADVHATAEDTLITVAAPGVLGNDTDADLNPLTAVLVAGPSHGTLTLNSNGSFTYTPAANFSGADSFTYQARDGFSDSNEVTVTITVTPVNDPPNAADDAATTAYQTPAIIAVLANDSPGDAGDTLTIQSLGPASGGTVAANLDGTVTFTPAAGFSGPGSFSYTVVDTGGLTDTASVTVTVGASNVAPTCAAARTAADLWPPNHQPVYVTVSGVVDPEGQKITITFNSILQDEPTNSVGQGNTMQDGGIEQNGTRAWVRAERSGSKKVPGDGRVYLIGFTARDPGGLTCTGTVRVDVPHDKRGTPAVLSPGRWNALTGQPVTPP
jgi:VCBS repeat-containing protein